MISSNWRYRGSHLLDRGCRSDGLDGYMPAEIERCSARFNSAKALWADVNSWRHCFRKIQARQKLELEVEDARDECRIAP